MQVRRLFASSKDLSDLKFLIKDDEAHYGIKVLRLEKGNPIEVITEKGILNGKVTEISKRTIEIEVDNSNFLIENEPEIEIVLFQGIPDHLEKLELITQKATELGVSKIIPFHSSYTDSKYKKLNLDKKFYRIRKIAKEAVRQCKRTYVPEVENVINFNEALEIAKKLDKTFYFAEYLTDKEKNQSKNENLNKIGVFIGAEGGFSEDEFQLLKSSSFKEIHLKGRVLRTETAAISAITLIQHQFGDYKEIF